MEKRYSLEKHVLKKMELFRARQRKIGDQDNERLRIRQHRELQDILSPFWAWRTSHR